MSISLRPNLVQLSRNERAFTPKGSAPKARGANIEMLGLSTCFQKTGHDVGSKLARRGHRQSLEKRRDACLM